MKNSKKFRLLLITAIMTFATISMAQITKQQAIDFVMDSIVGNQFDSVNVYMESDVQANAYYSTSSYDSIQSPYSEYWLFFIDQYPFALEWGHPCNYVFTDKQSGNTFIHYDQLPPFNYKLNLESVSISYEYITPSIDTLKTQLQSSYLENSNLYAVVFAVGNYWHGISHLFSTLKEKGFKQDNIYVLLEDGNPNNSLILDMDLNNDGIDDILENTICNYNSLDSIFNILKTKMTNEDILFLYSMSHGEQTDTINGLKLNLWNHSPILDSQLAAMIEPINFSQLIYFVLSCHSGGMLDNFNKPHQTIITCVDLESYYFGNAFVKSNTGMSPFEYGTITSLRGFHPAGKDEPWNQGEKIGDYENISSIIPYITSDDINPDSIINNGNNDYVIQLQEVFNYTSFIDTEFNTSGQFSYNLGFNEDLLSLTGISGKVNTTQTLEGNFLIGGLLSIEPDVELTLNNTTNFYIAGTKIVVKPGALLTIDNALLTSTHDTIWQGIEVWGDATQHQFEFTTGNPLAQGKLIMQNNATIQNAWNAVTTWKPEDWNTVGGIVIASNSFFENNNRSIEFMPYQNYNPSTGDPMGYVSKFTKCDFIVDNEYIMPNFNSHITMCDVNGVKIEGCEFTNSNTVLQNTGQGIFTINAGYIISDFCDAYIQPCPKNLTQTTFSNFHAGIIALNSGSSNTIYVNNAEFTNNGIGIQLNTVDNATIINNDFYIGINTYAENCFTDGFGMGIDLINSNGYAIEENKFYTAQGMTSDAIGINVYYNPEELEDPTIMYNEIYKNTFDGVHIANNAQGDNFNDNLQFGLVHQCNENSNNIYDFYITDQGIQDMQGSLDKPSGNTFSLNANNPFSDYNNQSEWSITYFYEENNTPETPMNYTDDSFFPINVENSNQCLSNYGDITKQDKGFGLTTSQLQYFTNIYNTNKIDYLGTKALYESLKDGGDTPGTITDVEGAWPDEMWETRNELLEKSPHLTREVLVETADRTDLFPDAVIFEIFSANPDAMKDKTLLEYLETKEDPLPQYMIDILAEAPGTISYKTILESDLAEFGGKKSQAVNVIIRNILNDSLVNTDSLVNWIGNLGTMAADYQIIDIYLQRGDTSTALALINALPTDYGFETDNAEYIRYKTLKQFQVQLLAEDRNIYMLTAIEKTVLEDMVANSSGRPGMQARNILQFIYGNEYNDCPNMPDPNTHKSGNSSIYDLTSNMLEITVSPNPAKNWVTFNYSIPKISTNSIIEIHNVKGELVHAINLVNYQGQVIWDTRNMQPGIYLFTLKSSGMIKSGKLIITK